MDLGAEGRFELGMRAREDDQAAARHGALNLEAMFCQPAGDLLHVLRGSAKLCAELRWAEPGMVVRRLGILLIVNKLLEGGLLSVGAFEEQNSAAELK
jgi:hypothetical protein